MISYSCIEEKDLSQIIALYENYLNSGEYIRNSMEKEFYNGDYLGFKACEDGEIVGFFTGQSGINFTCPHPELENEIKEFAKDRKIYTPDGLLVLEEYRGRGITRELVDRMRRALLDKKVELALVELWIYPDGSIPAQKPLRGIGEAVYQKKVPLFYKEIKKYGIRCPICGENCTCGALVELLEVKSDSDEGV